MRINVIRIAQQFQGWTLEYIRQLSQFDFCDILGVMDGDHKAKK